MMEIGSGWYPTLPFSCYLGGAARVVTIDLNRHMKPELAQQCAELLGNHLPTIAATCKVPEAEVRERHRKLVSRLRGTDVAAATDGVIEYRAPGDARHTGLPDASLDLVFSNSVLEHVPGDAIRDMYVEARRLLPDGRIMFHSVNCGDHYAYNDGTINQLNYLQFSDDEWEKWNNDFLYQNRLRAHEFVDMAEAAGFTIELNTIDPNERKLGELRKVNVHPQFSSRFSPEQLCITSVDFIARKRGPAVARA
jgi:SAM-dependent methyltransferase